jgi:hypothetical protein
MRLESDLVLGNGATQTGFVVHLAPGCINNSSVVGSYFGGLFLATDTDGASGPLANFNAIVPGLAYLQTNASSYRCLAACAQVFFPGTELNRSGTVSCVRSTYGTFRTGSVTSTALIRQSAQVVERMPNDHVEYKWTPSFSDSLFRNPNSTTDPEDGHSALTIAVNGLPTATGARVRVVSVVEWKPRPANGLILSGQVHGSGSAGVQAAREFLDRTDPNWWHHAGAAMASFVRGVYTYSTRGSNTMRLAYGEL